MSRPVALGVLVRSAARLFAALKVAALALARRRMLGQIGAMDDRMLRDIGLTRQDVWSVAAEPLFRDPTVGLAARADATRNAERATRREHRIRTTLRQLWAEDSRAA